MARIELDLQLQNFQYILTQLRAGTDAKRYGHAMSDTDKQQYFQAREIAKTLLAMEYDTPSDDELLTGMEKYVATFMETAHAVHGTV